MIAPQGRCHGPDTSACLLLLSCVLNFKKMEVEVWILIIGSSHWQKACPWKNRNIGCLNVSTRETRREMGLWLRDSPAVSSGLLGYDKPGLSLCPELLPVSSAHYWRSVPLPLCILEAQGHCMWWGAGDQPLPTASCTHRPNRPLTQPSVHLRGHNTFSTHPSLLFLSPLLLSGTDLLSLNNLFIPTFWFE